MYGNFGIGIEVYDAESNLILSKSASESGLSGVYSSDDLKNLLTLAEGETGFVRWSARKEFEKYDNKEFTFKLTSYLKIDKNAKKSAKVNSSSSSIDDDVDDISIDDDVDDIYNSALKEASDMYEQAQKEAEEMYQNALDEVSNW